VDIKVLVADCRNKRHAEDIVFLLNVYAADPMGGGAALDENVKEHVVAELARIPHAFSVLCYVDNSPAGLANCFRGFSTFKCKPIINIHDFVVAPEFRRQGISQRLLERIEELARETGCYKITLEVLEGNEPAQRAYTRFGFKGYQLDPATGKALFWEKII
jgi:GNAT superfamily N-acetyltransferase